MALAPLSQPDNRLYVGRGGSGKTTLALHHAGRFQRVLILNPNGEDAHRAGAVVVTNRADLVAMVRPARFHVCFEGFADDPDGAFDFCNRVALAAGGCVVLWDESDLFMTAQRLKGAAYTLWNMGRHYQCRVFAITRRPASVSRDVTGNLSRACVGQMYEPADQRFLRSFMGPANAAQCQDLAPYTFMDWTPDGAAVKKAPFA